MFVGHQPVSLGIDSRDVGKRKRAAALQMAFYYKVSVRGNSREVKGNFVVFADRATERGIPTKGQFLEGGVKLFKLRGRALTGPVIERLLPL